MYIPEGLPKIPNSNLSNVRRVVVVICTLRSVTEPIVIISIHRKVRSYPWPQPCINLRCFTFTIICDHEKCTVTQTPSKLLLIPRERRYLSIRMTPAFGSPFPGSDPQKCKPPEPKAWE